MAYSRFLGSDVYMALDGSSGEIWCYDCELNCLDDVSFTKRTDAIEHLKQHMAAGDIVGGRAIPLLEKEIRELGDEVRKTKEGKPMTIQMHEFVVPPDGPRVRYILIPLSIAVWDIFCGTIVFFGYIQTKRHLWLFSSIACFCLGIIMCAMGIGALKIFLEERGKSKTIDNKEHIENKA